MTSRSPSAQDRLHGLSKHKAALLELLMKKRSDSTGRIKPDRRRTDTVHTDLPPSAAQKRLWFIEQLEGGTLAYHVPVAVRLQGELHHATLQAALNGVIARHEALRTVVVAEHGEPMQRIVSQVRLDVPVVDLTDDDEPERALRGQFQQELSKAFDLGIGPLIRARLLKLSERDHLLLVTMHHIVSDGWSRAILLRELAALYAAHRDGTSDTLPPLKIQYADYAQWQQEWLGSAELQRQLGYWQEHLRGAPELIELPTDRPRPAVQSHKGDSVRVVLDADLVRALKTLARRFNATLAMALCAAWAVLLRRLSGHHDLVIGLPVANRQRAELEELIGFFVNTLAVRVRLHDDPTFATLLQDVKDVMLAAYAHQDVPFEKIVEVLQPSRSLSHSPIFQTLFVLQNTPRSTPQCGGLKFVEQDVPLRAAKFDLTLTLQEHADEVAGTLDYATDLFDATTIEHWIGCFKALLRAMVRDPQTRVSRLALLSPQETRRVVLDFNATSSSATSPGPIHELFEQQAARTPAAQALVYEGASLTYSELNARANQVARHLRGVGVGPGGLVGICVGRGLDMIVAMLGSLKAGAAYVPLDPTYPTDRLAHMMADAALPVVLTQQSVRASLPSSSARTIALDGDWSDIARHPTANLDAEQRPQSSDFLAYVIYTSGSTGRPKGVMVDHASVLNLYDGLERLYPRSGREQSVALNASFNFDASVQQFVQLLSGRALYVIPQATRQDPGLVVKFIQEHRIGCIDCTPSQLKSWVAAGLLEPEQGQPLHTVLVGGESIDPELWSRLAQSSDVSFYNVYGPTECTVDATIARINADEGPPHIGRPMPNRRVYVLDQQLEPLPVGLVGEIYIGGAGVARGYLNRPDLTAARFIADPFSSETGARLYRTGDLGRWRRNGVIEYLGRNDEQVKIRGYRIELGEIEMQLRAHAQVRDAAVLVREDLAGQPQLVAYVTADAQSSAPTAESLRTHLKCTLPDYMVPSAFVLLSRLPATPSGKLDRRALPAPELGAYASRAYEPPQGEVEEILAAIWCTLLCVERVGRLDNFFELGGHSLLIVQMLERLRRFGLIAEVRRVFETPTLSELANALTRDAGGGFAVPPNAIPAGCQAISPEMLPLVQLEPQHIAEIAKRVPGGEANIQDVYPLAPLQEGILFHHLLNETGSDVYIISILLSVESRVLLERLVEALRQVVARHDVLRTAVMWEQLPCAVQVVHREAAPVVEELALDPVVDSSRSIAEWLRTKGQRLDLGRAPLLRLLVAAGRDGQWHALLQLHHIAIDGQSLRALVAEVVAYLEHQQLELPPPLPYRNHVGQTLARAREADARGFFQRKLGDVTESTAPFGLLNVHGDGVQIAQAHEELDAALAVCLRAQARRMGVSVATLFHAAWALVTARTSGRDDVVFGSVLLGRLQGSASRVQQMLGMFLNTLPLRLRLHGITATELVEHTQRELVDLLAHEQASLADAQRCSGTGSAPLFTTLLNYRHNKRNSGSDWVNAGGIRVQSVRNGTNYPITLSVDDLGDGFRLIAQSDRRIDPLRIIGYMRTALLSLVDALEHAPQLAAHELSILPDAERQLLVETSSARKVELLAGRVIHQLFAEQVRRTPAARALLHADRSWTYAELDRRSNRLARYLKLRGVGPDQLVGICLHRSVEMVVAVIATLKAGGAYVPLDPSYPAERLQYMVKDAAPRVLLTQRELRGVWQQVGDSQLVELDAGDEIWRLDPDELCPEDAQVRPADLAYVIYTSGSTGLPKGTAMHHRALVNLIEWHREHLSAQQGARVLQFAALSFDVAFQEIFSTLCTGGTLVLLDEWIRRDARALLQLLQEQRIERLFLPPMMLQNLAEYFPTAGAPELRLRDVITAGEQLRISAEIVELFARLPKCRLHNHYGPTETHVVTTLTLPATPREWPTLPSIGAPISNIRIYILDEHRQLAPAGVVGEIYVGGVGVARGYFGQPQLTSQRFVADPFSGDVDARLYKTGDLGRWCADGTLDYLGRNDDQVKIRGYRIELGEIEAQLARDERVKEAAVVAHVHSSGEKRLVAYVALRGASRLSAEEMRASLAGVLPEHMIPSALMILDQLPLTPSGKLNRRALPAPDQNSYLSTTYRNPEGHLEETLARLWQSLLSVDRVGRDANFFELGGHSLLVLKAILAINSCVGCSLKVADMYNSPTVRDLARRIAGNALTDEVVDLASEATLDESIIAVRGFYRAPARAVLLTGGTGFVGRFMLGELLKRTNATIYCLVRAGSQQQASSRLTASMTGADLWSSQRERRVVPIAGDLRLPGLGMRSVDYQFLAGNVDSIFHCATSMNHLETYAMAKAANVDSAREIVKLATADTPKLINYVSTLGVFSATNTRGGRVVDEASLIDAENHLPSSGYTASKWVGEKIFMTAAQRGIPCNIFRLGLVWADSQLGRYDELQREFRIFKSCFLSGYGIRNYRYDPAPLPVDCVARAIVSLADIRREGCEVFHIAEQERTLEDVFERCNEMMGTRLELVPFYDWICHVRELHRQGCSLPVVPLVEYAFSMDEVSFYEQLKMRRAAKVRCDSTRTRQMLERAGIPVVAVGDAQLSAFVQNLLGSEWHPRGPDDSGADTTDARGFLVPAQRADPDVRASS